MRRRSYDIALVGIFSAFQLLCVVAGYYIDMLTLSFHVLAMIFVAVPLTRGAYTASILSYVAVSLLALLIVGIVGAMPYVLFSGIYTLATIIMYEKKVKWMTSLPIKIVWVNVAFYLLYEVFSVLVVDVSYVLPYAVYAVAISVLIIPIDWFILRGYCIIRAFIRRRLGE